MHELPEYPTVSAHARTHKAGDLNSKSTSSDVHLYAFPRSMRLLSAKDYSTVFGKSRRLSDRYWTVLVHERVGNSARLGLAIAKKRAKRAVDRNRIKRIARETIRCRQSELTGKDLIVMNRNETAMASSKELRISLDKLLGRLN